MTLPFWYLFQEALWSADTTDTEGSGSWVRRDEGEGGEGLVLGGDAEEVDKEGYAQAHAAQVGMAKAVYSELVRVLRSKVVFPPPTMGSGNANGTGWSKGLLL